MALMITHELDWQADASCFASADPDGFFAYPTSPAAVVARTVCSRCPVDAECLAYALEQQIEDGIWGGLDPAQRRAVVRRLKAYA